jgi:excinuclease ABC subunit A
LEVLHALVETGNTVLVIEHNLDIIKTADWVIDLGPAGGDKGGRIIATGTPENLVKVKASATGEYLKPVLARARAPKTSARPHQKTARKSATPTKHRKAS